MLQIRKEGNNLKGKFTHDLVLISPEYNRQIIARLHFFINGIYQGLVTPWEHPDITGGMLEDWILAPNESVEFTWVNPPVKLEDKVEFSVYLDPYLMGGRLGYSVPAIEEFSNVIIWKENAVLPVLIATGIILGLIYVGRRIYR